MKNLRKSIIAGSLCIATSSLQASTVTLEDVGFSRLYNTDQAGSGDFMTTHFLNVGTKANSNGWDMHTGLVFQMTGASASDLLTADFSISLVGFQGTPIYNVDVYANRVSTTANFQLSDFEAGTKLMDDFVTTSDTTGSYSLDTTGKANLLSYLQNNWVEDDYLFISLKANTDASGFIMGEDENANYNFGGGTSWSAGAVDAQLSVTAVPEPATTSLLGLGAIGVLCTRRR